VLAGRELPSQVGTALSGPLHALCLGPGEWLTISYEHTASNLREHFAPDLTKYGLAAVDLSDGLTVLEVSGSFAYDTLSKGCGLDLHPSSLAAGQCARTRLAQIPVVIEHFREPPRFELYVARSYLEYLRSWLADAAAELQGSST
jgi:sarcosine oxidase subunit gamma